MIIVIGGGAAGMMAAVAAAQQGGKVTLVEKMPALGKKILITGKGRCNLTNVADVNTMIRRTPGNGKFLYSALTSFDGSAVQDFFIAAGVPLKVERGGRVFPVSDKAQDIVTALVNMLAKYHVSVQTSETAREILVRDGKVCGLRTDKSEYVAAKIILATGGKSYPGTGSTGDGYAMAKALGHTVTPLFGALVPLETEETWVKEASGLSLRNVRVALLANGRKVADEFGEMLLAHFGVTGPIILTLSRQAVLLLRERQTVELSLDLKPALTNEQLEKRIERDFVKHNRKEIKNAVKDLLPGKLIEPVLDTAYLLGDKPAHSVTVGERKRLVGALKNLVLTVTSARPISEAIVTAGGIAVKEINPKTMESKLVSGLYFAGEIIDVDAVTGGYNLTAAFATGTAAGRSAAT